VSSDEEAQNHKEVDRTGDDEDEDFGTSQVAARKRSGKVANAAADRATEKRAKKNNAKKARKLVSMMPKNEESFDVDGELDGEADDEEMARTPPSSHHPSEDEQDDFSPA